MCSYNKAYAYSCMVVPLNPQLEMISGHIFEGKVLKTDVKKSLNPFRTPREKAQFVEFKVQKIWNGNFDYLMDEDGVIEVLEPLQGGGGCPYGFGFEDGKEYLVRLEKNGALMQAKAFGCTCSWSSELNSDFAKREIESLQAMKDQAAKE